MMSAIVHNVGVCFYITPKPVVIDRLIRDVMVPRFHKDMSYLNAFLLEI